MKKVFSLFKRAPKRMTAALMVLAAAIIIPAVTFAWGPDRATYTINSPADHVTFNSITDNPNVGDERNFVVAKDASNTADGGWSDNVNVQPGHEYIIRIYAHNNAASSLNLTAINTRVSASVPTTTGTTVPVSGFVSADNATPKQVWDDANFTTGTNGQQFNLAYVPGSAEIWNNGYAKNGASLPDSIVTNSGALIGYNGPDGKVPGCFQYANYIYIKVKPQFAPSNTFSLTKEVSKHGANKWSDNYTAQPGETVDYLLDYKNTGATQQDNVTFRDTLPAGMSYVAGSTIYGNSKNPSGVKASDNIANETGINVGSYAGGANAWAIFSAKVPSEDNLACGVNTLVNTGKVTTGGMSVSDTATVTVNKECKPPVTPTYTCKDLTASLVSDTTYKFNGSAEAANGATITGYSLDFGDGSTPFTGSAVSNVTHKYAQTGATYTARLTANVSVNDSNKTVTSNACTVKITVGQPPVTPPTTPSTPTELPHTGVSSTAASIVGLGAIVLSLGYYVASRRAAMGR